MNRALAHVRPQPSAPSALPDGMQRSDLERLLTRCGDVAFGLEPAHIRTLLIMIQHTPPTDWTDPQRTPVCFAAQTVIAEAAGRSTRAIRATELAAQRAGVIIRKVGDNGARGRWNGYTLGLDFTPMIERVEDLIRADKERTARIKRRSMLRKMISAARRQVRTVTADLFAIRPDSIDLPAVQHAIASWCRRYDGFTLPALEQLLSQTETLYRHVAAILQAETSGATDANDLPLQEQIDDKSCSCESDEGPALRPGASVAGLEKAEKPNRQPDMDSLGWVTPAHLYQAAHPDFRFYLDAYAATAPLDQWAFVKAALARCGDLAIRDSAWHRASRTMGDFGAALCVLVIDARREDVIRPIHSPGGALTAFARKAETGDLHLAGSLIRLLRSSDGMA